MDNKQTKNTKNRFNVNAVCCRANKFPNNESRKITGNVKEIKSIEENR